jgi:hypothetical protein
MILTQHTPVLLQPQELSATNPFSCSASLCQEKTPTGFFSIARINHLLNFFTDARPDILTMIIPFCIVRENEIERRLRW